LKDIIFKKNHSFNRYFINSRHENAAPPPQIKKLSRKLMILGINKIVK